jgi:hypothetical protein
MPIAGSPAANSNPAGSEGPSGTDSAAYYPAGYLKQYTIGDLVNLAAAVSYVASPTNTGPVSTVKNFYGLAGKESSYRWDPITAAAIAMAESTGNPQAVNQSSQATGLWQEEPVNWKGKTQTEVMVPNTNAELALATYESQGWGAWTTYKTGAYLKYVAAAKASDGGQSVAQDQAINSSGQSSLGASSQVGDWLKDLGITISWKEIGVLFLGGIALILGMYLLVKGK